MSMICRQCGKTIEGEGIAFCPYCGAKLVAEPAEEARNGEAEKWIRKALSVTSYPERKKILLKGLEACPGSREIEWELLFVGEDPKKKGRFIDFSIIRCWVLDIYRNPGNYSAEKRDSMRSYLFDSPQLARCLQMFDDPAVKQKEYLLRLCSNYIEIFLEGDNQVAGRLFGFSIERNKEKRMARPVAEMILRMKEDEKLSPDQREQLWKSMYQAYGNRTGGKMEWLDGMIQNEK